MQIMITHGSLARTRVLQLNPWQITLAAVALVVFLMAISGAIYHFVFLKAARDGWPVVSSLVRLVVRDEIAQRERFMRENLDAMAQRVGEMQAKVVKLEAVSERVSGLAGVKPDEVLKALPASGAGPAKSGQGGQGGPFIPAPAVLPRHASAEEINLALTQLDERTDLGADLLTLAESLLFESKLRTALVPSSAPVQGPVGSGFGFRSDPFTGRAALHTGLDFPAEPGTPVVAAAGGMVVTNEWHPQYGHLLEIDHGNGLVTRYAHNSRVLVKLGDLVKRGQKVSEVGSSGRSTGPHLHFEVLVQGVPQDPARFLAAAGSTGAPGVTTARR